MENIPSEVGQLVEVKSFQPGYRGAWFRCKVMEDAESVTFRNILKRSPREKEYLYIYWNLVITRMTVGDLVDWMDSGCFWCGNITEVFDDQEAQIELRPPPRGEGGSYKVHFKDLRPSLDWCPERGWTLPTQEDGTGNPCARLIEPINQVVDALVRVEDTHDVAILDVSRSDGLNARLLFSSPILPNFATSSDVKSTTNIEMKKCVHRSTLSKEQKNDIGKNASHGYEDGNIKESSQVNAYSSQSAIEQEVADILDDMSLKKYMTSGGDTLNSKRAGTIEATILDLEEYINKVKWLKKILQHGVSS